MKTDEPTPQLPPHETVTEKATRLGWFRTERLGKIVWYDPEGGHVLEHELGEWLDRHESEQTGKPEGGRG